MGIRQRANERHATDTKYGGIGSDAESEGENGDGSEGRRFAELAKGEAAIREDQMEPVFNAILANHARILAVIRHRSAHKK